MPADVGEYAVHAEVSAAGRLALEDAVRNQEERVAGRETDRLAGLDGCVRQNAERKPRGVKLFVVAVGPHQDYRPLAATGVGDGALGGVGDRQRERYEAALADVGCQQPVRVAQDDVRPAFPKGQGPHERPCLCGQQRRSDTVSDGVAQHQADTSVAPGEDVEEIAAGVFGRLAPAGQVEPVEAGWVLRQEADLDVARQFHLVLEPALGEKLFQQPRTLQRHACLVRQGRQQGRVVFGERAGTLIEGLEHADEFAFEIGHGDGQDIPGPPARLLIDVGIEPRVGVDVRDDEWLLAACDGPGDAAVGGEANDLDLALGDGAAGEFVGSRVVEEERGPLGIQQFAGFFGDGPEERIQTRLGGQPAHDPKQDFEVPAQGRFVGLGVVAHPRVTRRS